MITILLFFLPSIYGKKIGHGNCQDLPMKSARITYAFDTGTAKPHHPPASFVVASDNEEVYALADGKVVGLASVGKYEALGVTYRESDTQLAYIMLTKIALKAGDQFKKGDLIGTGTRNKKTGKTECAILVKVISKAYTMPNKEVMAFIDRMNN